METSPVIHLVTDAKGTVIHEVHVQMQELPLGMKTLTPEVRASPGSGATGAGRTRPAFPVLSLAAGEARRRAARAEGWGAGGEGESEGRERGPWGSPKHSSGYAWCSLGHVGSAPCSGSKWVPCPGHLASFPPSACPQPPGPEELPCPSEGGRENLLHQAMQNSGIVLERVTEEEGALEPAPPAAPSPQTLGDGPSELPLLEVEPVETVGACDAGVLLRGGLDLGYKVTTQAWQLSSLIGKIESPSAGTLFRVYCLPGAHGIMMELAGGWGAVGLFSLLLLVPSLQWVLEMCFAPPQQVASGASTAPRTHPCPQCSETFPTAAILEAHKRGHAGGCRAADGQDGPWVCGGRLGWSLGGQQAGGPQGVDPA